MQGWGDNGPDDAESWENMLPEFQNFLGIFSLFIFESFDLIVPISLSLS
jgi:hypothetical protein